jgi:hypothetical protein
MDDHLVCIIELDVILLVMELSRASIRASAFLNNGLLFFMRENTKIEPCTE